MTCKRQCPQMKLHWRTATLHSFGCCLGLLMRHDSRASGGDASKIHFLALCRKSLLTPEISLLSLSPPLPLSLVFHVTTISCLVTTQACPPVSQPSLQPVLHASLQPTLYTAAGMDAMKTLIASCHHFYYFNILSRDWPLGIRP